MLRHGNEDAWWQSHVEDAVRLLPALFQLFQVLPQLDEGVVLVVLARYVCADADEIAQLIFHVLVRRLDVRLDPLQEFGMVHLRPRVADDLDIFGEEVVAVLWLGLSVGEVGGNQWVGAYEAEECRELSEGGQRGIP
jgi:hypothetical protein